MVYTELTKKAMRLAYEQHDCQSDRGGTPYIFHPYHIAEQMETEREICVALLHDILEDTIVVPEELRQMGFPDDWVDDIVKLTKTQSETYDEYIMRLAPFEVPRKVKLADLRHNATLERLDKVTEKDIARKTKYIKYIKILEKM